MGERALPWRGAADGIVVCVRLTPKASRDAIDGIAQLTNGESVLKVRVRAAPSAGEANAAVIQLLAGAFGVPPRHVHLLAGLSARRKRVKIVGAAAALGAALTRICARE
jgi:uncharacterized protein